MSGPEVLIGGRYRLLEQIATGGMGSVWEAWDERLQRRVALKQLHPQAGLSAADARLATHRAMREARITARLHHAHAVAVYDVVDHDGMPCLIMQFLPSKSLQSVLAERGTLSVAEVARIGSEVAAALAAAHELGIVHRDVKPGNILIDSAGSAKLTDFGISHAYGDVSLTSTGMVTGTPAFLAPEIARGIESGFASDVFSLGATLYAALEGTPPFGEAENPMALLHRVASGQLNPPRRSGRLTPILNDMLAADPGRRPSMAQAGQALTELHLAATDPAASARTQRLDTAPPPSTTVSLPPVRLPGDTVLARTTPPRRKTAIALLAFLLLAGAGILLVSQLSGRKSNNSALSSHSPTASNPASHPPTQPARSSKIASSAPRTSAPTTSTETNITAKTSGNASNPGPSNQIQALDSYYALLPGDTAAAWNRLTSGYQNQIGGRAVFDNFWGSFQSIQISNERTQGGQVLADLRYTSTNGNVATETRSFRFVNDGGVLKIADSRIVSG